MFIVLVNICLSLIQKKKLLYFNTKLVHNIFNVQTVNWVLIDKRSNNNKYVHNFVEYYHYLVVSDFVVSLHFLGCSTYTLPFRYPKEYNLTVSNQHTSWNLFFQSNFSEKYHLGSYLYLPDGVIVLKRNTVAWKLLILLIKTNWWYNDISD